MSAPIITVENLGKKYRLSHQVEGQRYKALRDVIVEKAKRLLRSPSSRTGLQESSARTEEFWALRDVSFEVKEGEVLGIIGRNGAGKSTLLKILSRITEPTTGQVRIRGRVASLLEVGTGFHPELTGRENIYLNGAILGMKKAEIKRKFDEIVVFAEVEKFLDTPVKRYSSGMYVRLAFAVAAHLEPEILVVDEVLAVGDHEFQKKCLNKMGEVAKTGRTIFFVSHSMAAIQRLCSRALVLDKGRITADSIPGQAISEYLSGSAVNTYEVKPSPSKPSITKATAYADSGAILLSVEYQSPFPLVPILGFVLYDAAGTPLFGTNELWENPEGLASPSKSGLIRLRIPAVHLRPSHYVFSLFFGDHYHDYCILEKILQVELLEGLACPRPRQEVGSLHFPVEWRHEKEYQLTQV